MKLLLAKYHQLLDKQLLKVIFSTGFASFIKILSTVLLSKIIAVKLGRDGLAMFGQLNNVVSFILLLATSGFSNAIVHSVAKSGTTYEKQNFLKQAFKVTFINAAIIALLVLIFSVQLSMFSFNSKAYQYIFQILSLSVIFYSIGVFYSSFLNGSSEFKLLNRINIISSLINLLLSIILVLKYSLAGAFLGLILSQVLFFFIARLIAGNVVKTVILSLSQKINITTLKTLFSFSLITLIPSALAPVLQIFIRKSIIAYNGVFAAGEWEASNRISNIYLFVLNNILLIYYLPKLSSLDSRKLISLEIKKAFFIFLPAFTAIAACILIGKGLIISFFFSKEFLHVEAFLLPLLIGDFFKILAYIFAYLLIAKKVFIYYLFAEIVFVVMYALFASHFLKVYGTVGVTYGYALVSFVYFFLLLFFVRKYLHCENSYSGFKFR